MKISIKPVRDYNKKDYKTPVAFQLIVEDEDAQLLEALKAKIEDDWLD